MAPEEPPLTSPEIQLILKRAESGEEPSRSELRRLERQGSVWEGNCVITCYRGNLTVKRYLGVDPSWF